MHYPILAGGEGEAQGRQLLPPLGQNGVIEDQVEEATVDGTGKGSARHRFIAVASQPGEIQEFALILGPGSELRTFPAALRVSAGSLRLFLTSLDHAVTIVIRREGAQAGISTALVEPVKLTILEIELAQGVYEIVPQGEDVVLGRIEAR